MAAMTIKKFNEIMKAVFPDTEKTFELEPAVMDMDELTVYLKRKYRGDYRIMSMQDDCEDIRDTVLTLMEM